MVIKSIVVDLRIADGGKEYVCMFCIIQVVMQSVVCVIQMNVKCMVMCSCKSRC